MFRRTWHQFVADHTPWGPEQGLLAKLAKREHFSRYFNWKAYDPETKVYSGYDNSIGFLWETTPLSFADPNVLFRLESLLQASVPEGSIIQLHFHADDYLKPFLDTLRSKVVIDTPLAHESTERLIETFSKGTVGLDQLSGIPVRNFRLLVAFKMPVDALDEVPESWLTHQQTLHEILKGSYLNPRFMEPERLLAWARWMLNGQMDDAALFNYDPTIPINRQVLCANTEIEDLGDRLKIGKRYFRATTPKNFPQHVDLLQTHELFGGIWGVASDAMQIPTPFLFTLNILYERDSIKSHLHTKCNMMLQQKAAGSFAPSLLRKQQELMNTVDQIDRGVSFVRIIPTMWVWHENDKKAYESIIRIRSLWEPIGYVMQEDRQILQILFLLSLPFGLNTEKRLVETLERDFIMQAPAVARLMPVQADFTGAGEPVLPFVGRKGQVIGVDLFTKEGGTNHNGMILASSGTGKSFLACFIAFRYRCAGAKLRIIDIGGSYRKLTKMMGARFLEFRPETPINLNPFTHLKNDDDGTDDPGSFLKPVQAVFTQMCFSNASNPDVSTLQTTLINQAVRGAWNEKRNDAGSNDVYEFLATFPEKAPPEFRRLTDKPEIINEAHLLALYMQDFISSGPYGRYFNGPSDFDISNDDIVVLELEHLKPQPALFNVITLQIINAVTADLYLAKDRSIKRLIILDEAWQILNTGGDAQQLAHVVEGGYRRARKYGGSFTVISQSLQDLPTFGPIGAVINANSAYKFFLQSPDFNWAKKDGWLSYDEFTMKLLNTTKSAKPRYSEIFIDTPQGTGHVRFMADPFNYYVYTSDPDEVQEIDNMVDQGMSYEKAIEEMVKKYRGAA